MLPGELWRAVGRQQACSGSGALSLLSALSWLQATDEPCPALSHSWLPSFPLSSLKHFKPSSPPFSAPAPPHHNPPAAFDTAGKEKRSRSRRRQAAGPGCVLLWQPESSRHRKGVCGVLSLLEARCFLDEEQGAHTRQPKPSHPLEHD